MNPNLKITANKWYLGFLSVVYLGFIYMLLQAEGQSNMIIGYIAIAVLLIVYVSFFFMHVTFDQDSMSTQIFFFTFSIPYNQVEKVKVSRFKLQIEGNGHRIAISKFTHANFQSASNLLASKIDGLGDIKLTGKEKYLQEYLQVIEQDTEQ